MTDANTFFGYFVRFIATWKTAELENEKRRQMEMRAAATQAARGAAEQAGEEEGGSNRVVGRKNNVSFGSLAKENIRLKSRVVLPKLLKVADDKSQIVFFFLHKCVVDHYRSDLNIKMIL